MSVPRIRLDKLHGRAVKVRRCFDGIGAITDEAVRTVTSRLYASVYGEDGPPRQHVQDTIAQYVGKNATLDVLRIIGYQMAAREQSLYAGPLPGFSIVCSETVAFEVLSSKPCLWQQNDSGHEFRMLALTGHIAGSAFSRKFPDRWLVGLAYKLGFSRRVQFDTDSTIFAGFRFWAAVKPSDRDNRQPEFCSIEVDNQIMKHNKILIKARMRFDFPPRGDENPCPRNFDHLCSECKELTCFASYNRDKHA